MERNSLFSSDLDQGDIESKATSSIAVERWLAAVALGQTHEQWAFDLLRVLKTDSDDNTRTAATNALQRFPKNFQVISSNSSSSSYSGFIPGVWKIRPLPKYESQSKNFFLAAVLDIVNTEGPVTGGRVQNRLSSAWEFETGARLGKRKVKTLLDDLIGSNALTRADMHLDSNDIDLWIVHFPGTVEFIVRPRNGRLLTEIPVNEARSVIQKNKAYRKDSSKRDDAFSELMNQYEIKPNEFFLVGEAMEHQWQTLFTDETDKSAELKSVDPAGKE